MDYQIDYKEMKTSFNFFNHIARKYGEPIHGWKRVGSRSETNTKTVETPHSSRQSVSLTDKTGNYVGNAYYDSTTYTYKEEKETTYYSQYARLLPLCDDKQIKWYQKIYTVVRFVREITNKLLIPSISIILFMALILDWEALMETSIGSFVLKVIIGNAISFAVTVVLSIVLGVLHKIRIEKLNYNEKRRDEIRSRIARLENDYKQNKIGFDTFSANRKKLYKWLSAI